MIDNPPPVDLWIEAFIITCLVELPLYWLLLRRRLGEGRPWLLALAANLATHPTLWYVVPRAPEWPWALWVVVVETGVFVTEGLMMALALARLARPPIRPARAVLMGLAVAFAANAVSTGVGLVLQAFGWGSGE